MVTARAKGKRVEDLSQRSETTAVFANPDSTWTVEENPDPVRVKDEQGDWHDIDTTLVAEDGGIAPKYTASDVVLSDGGDKTIASMTEGGKDLEWRWPDTLPTPTLEGNTATYANVVPGGDLVVRALGTGFSHSIVLREAPDAPLRLTMPIRTDGGDVVQDADGSLAVQTAGGDELVSAPRPVMYDASGSDPAGDPTGQGEDTAPTANGASPEPATVPVEAAVGETAAGTPTVTLSPDQGFLTDPDTQYPVTVDPSWTTYASHDTYIASQNNTDSQVSSTNLRVGTTDSGATVRRTFLKFGYAPGSTKHVTAATLRMYNWNSGSCTAGAIRVQKLIENWDSNNISWANQPAASATGQVDFSPAYGVAGQCGNNYASWDVTNIVQSWTTDPNSNFGVRVRGATETSNNTYRSYASVNNTDTNYAKRPRIDYTYNTYPGTASAPTVSASASYTATGGPASYTSTTTPTFTSSASDADGGNVTMLFEARASAASTATLLAPCTSDPVASGASATCTPPALIEGSTYYLRSKAKDGMDWAGKSQAADAGWSKWTKFVVASVKPAAPVITCPSYADGSWTNTAPAANVACTISAAGSGASAPVRIRYQVNGSAETIVSITPSSSAATAKTTITVPKTPGRYDVRAIAESSPGLVSDDQHLKFGYGTDLGVAAPAKDPLPITTSTFALDAAGPPTGTSGTPTATVQWRLASSNQNAFQGWNTATGADLTVTNSATAGVHVTGRWDTTTATHDANTNMPGQTSGGTDLDARKPVLIDVQICIAYPGGTQCTWSASSGQRSVMRVPHAFGDGFPTADAGPGQVALWTGEFNTDTTDVSVPGFTGDLSLSRSASTYAGPPSKAAGVFGPGWTAELDGPDAGLAGMQLLDSTRTDGTLVLVDGDGSVMVFGPHAGVTRRTTGALAAGAWDALDQDTQIDGTKANVGLNALQQTVVTFTEADGTKTAFTAAVGPTAGTDATFAPSSVQETGTQGTTGFGYDYLGRVTRMVANAPAGISCPATGTLVRGCRALDITYTPDTGTPPAGQVNGQVKSVAMTLWNPDKTGGAGMDSIPVAAYSYDSAGRLASVTDPRSSLTTNYSYDGTSSRLASITPPGQKTINLTYGGSDHRLVNVERDRPTGDPTGGTATLASVVYNVPTTGNSALPSLTDTAVAAWGQTSTPTYAAAVFGADNPVHATIGGALIDPAAVAAGDWPYADLSYTDARGYTINTASKGAGAWQLTSTGYDQYGNEVRSLDEGDIAAIKAGQVAAPDAGTTTVYNTDQVVNGNVVLPAGSVVTDTYGPVRLATIGDGSLQLVRPHTHTDYDQGAPNSGVNPDTGQAYALATTETTTADDAATGSALQTMSTEKTGYAPVPAYGGAAPTAADIAASWAMGQATTSTTVIDGAVADITSKTRYDSVGRTIETRQPKSNGNDAGTRRTSYYTADQSGSGVCDGHPEWAGLPCVTDYAAAPSSGPALTTTKVTAYNAQLQATATTETSGSATRTSTTSYLADGRTDTEKTAVAGLPSSTPLPATKHTYDPTSGVETMIQSLDGSGNPTGAPANTSYDDWGRITGYSAATGDNTTTTYNAAGDVATVTDDKGTTTYTYNGTDAAGNAEYRGMATKLTVSDPGGPAIQFTGAYDADGALTTQKMPGGLTQHTDYDVAGEPVGLAYSGQVTNDDGTTSVDAPWLSWSQANDVTGRVRLEGTPDGAAYQGALTGGDASGYSRVYSYDQASRLTKVIDNSAPDGTGGVDQPTDGIGTADYSSGITCQTRSYGFDTNGNRTTKAVAGANADGSCATTGGSTKGSTYDTADRLTTGYAYDNLGRTTTIPAADTPAGTAAGDVSLGYYDDDSALSLAQNGSTTTYTLDQSGRRLTSTISPTVGGPATEVVTRHYSDENDRPAWVSSTKSGASTEIRYAEAIDDNLGVTLTSSTDGSRAASLQLINLHGDVASTVSLPMTGAASAIEGWTSSDEYGIPVQSGYASAGIRYGWLGGEQRASDLTGVMTMGVRLYNPATGMFASVDPIFGGNTTDYAYPQDPVNDFDITGLNRSGEMGGLVTANPQYGEGVRAGGGGRPPRFSPRPIRGSRGRGLRFESNRTPKTGRARPRPARNVNNRRGGRVGQVFATRSAAIKAANRFIRRYRGPHRAVPRYECREGCHVHVDIIRGKGSKGQVVQTRHYNYRRRR